MHSCEACRDSSCNPSFTGSNPLLPACCPCTCVQHDTELQALHVMLELSALHPCAVHNRLRGRLPQAQLLSAAALDAPCSNLAVHPCAGPAHLWHWLAQRKHCQTPAGSSSNLLHTAALPLPAALQNMLLDLPPCERCSSCAHMCAGHSLSCGLLMQNQRSDTMSSANAGGAADQCCLKTLHPPFCLCAGCSSRAGGMAHAQLHLAAGLAPARSQHSQFPRGSQDRQKGLLIVCRPCLQHAASACSGQVTCPGMCAQGFQMYRGGTKEVDFLQRTTRCCKLCSKGHVLQAEGVASICRAPPCIYNASKHSTTVCMALLLSGGAPAVKHRGPRQQSLLIPPAGAPTIHL